MSLIRINQNPQSYYIWISSTNESSISIQILNGSKIWDGKIGTEDKPQSRCRDADIDYFFLLERSLKSIDYAKYDYSIIIENSIAQLTIKERLVGMSSLLIKTKLYESQNSENGYFMILQSVSEIQENASKKIQEYEDMISGYKDSLESVLKESSAYIEKKNAFQDEFILKLCLLLNSKKQKIRQLESQVDRLERMHNSNTNSAVMNAETKFDNETDESDHEESRLSRKRNMNNTDDDTGTKKKRPSTAIKREPPELLKSNKAKIKISRKGLFILIV